MSERVSRWWQSELTGRTRCVSLDLHESIMSQDLLTKLESRQAIVGVIGLGYVGLPLLDAFIQAGFRTIGFDVDERKVGQLNSGKSYIKHVPSSRVQEWLKSDHFEASADLTRLKEPDAIVICVPTPLNESRDPDMSYIVGTGESIARHLRPGQLIVLESTTYPTTTRNVLLPILQKSGLEAGRDFFVAYSPEREDPGNPVYSAAKIPKVVGGLDEASRELACSLYRPAVVQVVPVKSTEVAEAAKILENTYRAVNIALVNELKILFDRMQIDIWEVIEAARTKPFGFQPFYPGPGLGGHCIPIDPFYLTWLARRHGLSTRFIELAGEVNSKMPEYVIHRLSEFLNDIGKPIRGSRICLLGMAYKKDVDDSRESPSFSLMELLIQRGANLSYNDPHVPVLPPKRDFSHLPELQSQPLTPAFLAEQDCVLIATDHSVYDFDFIVKHSKMVLDTRNATRKVQQGIEKIRRA